MFAHFNSSEAAVQWAAEHIEEFSELLQRTEGGMTSDVVQLLELNAALTQLQRLPASDTVRHR